ncbi:hypothetical protein GF402_02210 [Candidatus Fermentibacteria bacterium]|nr:hypothetical protein [Candidatus Fermentibacteria bacterium]
MSRRPGAVTLSKLSGAGYARLLGLSGLETLLALTWSYLLHSLAGLLLSNQNFLIPLWYLASCMMISLLERYSRFGDANPLGALGILQLAADGERPCLPRIFLRVLLTPPCLLVLTLGLAPAGFGKASVAEYLSGIRLVQTVPALDPRSPETITSRRRSVLARVSGYALLSLAAAGVVASLPEPSIPLNPRVVVRGAADTVDGPDRELLREYLQMSARCPDSIEYHVRLASLYYRNDMRRDLRNELLQIRRLDPHHPMLLLGEDVDLTFGDLLVHVEEGSPAASGSVGIAEATPFYSHSPGNDRLLITSRPDSQVSTGGPAPEDSVYSSLHPDSALSEKADTASVEEVSPDSTTTIEPSGEIPADSAAAGDTLQPVPTDGRMLEDAESNI